MSRFVTDILILVGIILGVRVVADGSFDVMAILHTLGSLPTPHLPFDVHWPSFALGMVAGAILYAVLGIRWESVPLRTAEWFSSNGSRLSYVGLSLGFAIVLLYF
ncbi:MAG: hypothetical protein KJ622_08945 [Alphaproteobacteria bacterium]|nr:hypothetical protein [Alphaproteobacteria bacterium]